VIAVFRRVNVKRVPVLLGMIGFCVEHDRCLGRSYSPQLQGSHALARPDGRGVDDENLVSCAGLVPVLDWLSRPGLSRPGRACAVTSERFKSGAGPTRAPKLTPIIAGMAVCSDNIERALTCIRSGG